MRVLIVDQAVVSLYALQQRPMLFDNLIAHVRMGPLGEKAEVREVADDFKAEWGTTVLKADADGYAVAHDYKWDSSG